MLATHNQSLSRAGISGHSANLCSLMTAPTVGPSLKAPVPCAHIARRHVMRQSLLL